jgi:hypothetical protein
MHTDRSYPSQKVGIFIRPAGWRRMRFLRVSGDRREKVFRTLKSLYIMADPIRFDKWPESNNPYFFNN